MYNLQNSNCPSPEASLPVDRARRRSALNPFRCKPLALALGLFAAGALQAQVVVQDIGASAPTPGTYDISQLVYGQNYQTAGAMDLNYYWNNGNLPGQSFTTGSNPQGYTLTSVAFQTAGNGGGGQLDSQTFTLDIYQLSGTGPTTTATLLDSFTATGTLAAEGDWLQFTGIAVSLQPNTLYAYSFGGSSGWELLSTDAGLPYAGGQICVIPPAGGQVEYNPTPNTYDATFDIGLIEPAAPIPNSPIETPNFGTGGIVAGTPVTFTASASGSQPIAYQWQTDGGSGGALTNIPGAIGTNLLIQTTGWALGTYQFDYVATNTLGSAVSSVATITIVQVAMVDLGTNAPTPGPNDISQLLNTDQQDDGFNYYTDNGAGHGNWCGQTFTTGTNSNGYLLQTLAWKSAGNGSSFNVYQLYDLYFYAINGTGGTNATLIDSYQCYGGGTQEDWFQFQGLSVGLAPNTLYGYTFGRDASSSGWEHIGDQGNNPYPGGQLMTIANANTNGGPVTYGATGNSDATFSLGLIISQKPFASAPTYTPNVNPIYAATPITLQELAVGTPPLTYQWYTDNGTGGALVPVNGATGTNLLVNTTGYSGNYTYKVVVQNGFGSSTSAPVILNFVAASAPLIVNDISPAVTNQGYVGQILSFATTFTGTLPITYQWYVNSGSGLTAISAASNPTATNATLVLTNLQPNQAGIYSVTAHTSQGSLSSSSSDLAVLPDPAPPGSGTYGALVLSGNPVALWQLNETNDPSTGVLPAYDASGHNLDGVYGQNAQNAFNGIAGPQAPTYPGFAANNPALQTIGNLTNSWVNLPPLNLDTNAVTITMWINPVGTVNASAGLLMNRNNNDAAGFCFGSAVNAAGMAELGYTWNTNSSATYGFNSGLYPVIGTWSYVALVIQPNQATIYLYYIDPTTGQPDLYSAVNPIAHGPETFGGGTTWIGDDQDSVSRVFNGSIDEVAVYNYALTGNQLLAQFGKGVGLTAAAPAISGQPESIGAFAGNTVNFTATDIDGTSPFTYQWKFNGNNLTDGGQVSGSQTPSLTISSVSSGNAGSYQLFVQNSVATTASSNATLIVVTPAAGSYEAAVLAQGAYIFWPLNETSDPSVGGVPALEYIRGQNGIYQTGAENGFDGILGPQLPGFPADDTALGTLEGTADSYVTASVGTLATNTLTYAMWIKPSGNVENWAGLLMDRGGAGEGLGFGGEVNAAGMSELGYTWNQNSTWSYDSLLFPPTNEWSFVAMVIEPSQATLYLINSNGTQTAVNAITQDNEEFGVAWHIGDDAVGSNGGRTFPGSIADVSVFLTALSSNQITALYDAGLKITPPAPTLSVARSTSGNLTLTWSQGTLLQSTNVLGPWSTSTATSPLTVSPTGPQMFYRAVNP